MTNPHIHADVPTALYRFYDTAGGLLYVGITWNLKQRWRQHQRDKFWWPDVDRRAVHWYDNRAEAVAAEARVVEDEHPLYDQTDRQGAGAKSLTVSDLRAERDTALAVERLKAAVAEGVYRAGQRLPSYSSLAARHGVSEAAIGMALERLCRGRVLAREGHGRHVVVGPSDTLRGEPTAG